MHEQSSVLENPEQLSAFFDGELDDHSCALIQAEFERDPELAARLGDLSFMHDMVVGDLEFQSERVPEARFEQIWDNFERTLERESRLQEAAEDPPSVWARLSTWMGARRMPLTAVGVVGALVFVIARSVGAPSETVATNTQEVEASDGEPAAKAPEPAPEVAPTQQLSDQDRVAVAPVPQVEPEMFPQPEPGEAEIRRIEFGGRAGTISQLEGVRGTTTVIWVTEDEAPVDSERSL